MIQIETKDQIKQFLILHSKTDLELRAICEGLQLPTSGTRAVLLNRLITTESIAQIDIRVAQTIPLRSRSVDHKPINLAIDLFQVFRKELNKNGKIQSFKTRNKYGKEYEFKALFIPCSSEHLDIILQNRLYLSDNNQRDLVDCLKKDNNNFNVSIIQKLDGKGNNWLTLHCEPRRSV